MRIAISTVMNWRLLSFLAVISIFLGGIPGISVAASESVEGFKAIFDGKTLEGWDGDERFWRVEDEAITGQTTDQNQAEHNTFIIWRGGEVDDFELKLEYRIFGHNSGVQYRSFEDPEKWGKWVIHGYQADMDFANKWSGTLYGEKYRGVLGARGEKTVIGADHKRKVVGSVGDPAELQTVIKQEDWNEYHIIARGNHFMQYINGRLMVDVTDEDEAMRRRAGILALQLHRGPSMKVQFKNIRLKRLPLRNARKVVFIAGTPSHGFGSHEHNGGCDLLANALNQNMENILATVYHNGWPSDPTAFDNADALVFYCDGGGRHFVNQNLEQVDRLMKKGVGLGCIHYAVEVPKEGSGKYFLDWIGGYFEAYWSVNPHWIAKFENFPKHPVTAGVQPFEINDEWYYFMRFREKMDGVTPILSAVPPDESRERNFGKSHGGHEKVVARRGMTEHVSWVRERPDGGRGFGFTGGHFHWNWGNDDFRKLVLNQIVWIAGAEVPSMGVNSQTPTRQELERSTDPQTSKSKKRKKARTSK